MLPPFYFFIYLHLLSYLTYLIVGCKSRFLSFWMISCAFSARALQFGLCHCILAGFFCSFAWPCGMCSHVQHFVDLTSDFGFSRADFLLPTRVYYSLGTEYTSNFFFMPSCSRSHGTRLLPNRRLVYSQARTDGPRREPINSDIYDSLWAS